MSSDLLSFARTRCLAQLGQLGFYKLLAAFCACYQVTKNNAVEIPAGSGFELEHLICDRIQQLYIFEQNALLVHLLRTEHTSSSNRRNLRLSQSTGSKIPSSAASSQMHRGAWLWGLHVEPSETLDTGSTNLSCTFARNHLHKRNMSLAFARTDWIAG
jgi:hypothetical protein